MKAVFIVPPVVVGTVAPLNQIVNGITLSEEDDIDFRFLDIIGEKSRIYSNHKDHIFIDEHSFGNENPITQIDALRSLYVENAGGKSEVGEALSIQYFFEKFNATNVILEKEVEYKFYNCKMVDFICTIGGIRLGVSVTRAMGYPNPDKFDREAADHLLHKKLYGLIVARNAVNKNHRFFKSILHIFCQTAYIASLLQEAYASLDINDFNLNIRGAVILRLTICPDIRIYENKL